MEGKGSGRAVKSLGRADRRFHTSLPKRTLSRSPAKETIATEALAKDSGPATAKESTLGSPLGRGSRGAE